MRGQADLLKDARKFNELHRQVLVEIVMEGELLNLHDLAGAVFRVCGFLCTAAEVWRALDEIGFSRVRITTHSAEANPEQQRVWREKCNVMGYTADNFVFLDEVASVSDLCICSCVLPQCSAEVGLVPDS